MAASKSKSPKTSSNGNKKKKKQSSSSSSSSPSSFSLVSSTTLVTLGVVSAALALSAAHLSQHHPTPAPSKRYTTFESFYPYYLSEHSDQNNRYLHFLGTTLHFLLTLYEPRLLLVGPLVIGVGLNMFYLTLGVAHGWIEFTTLLTTFLVAGRLITGKWSTPSLSMVVGYTWAWVGHYFIEKNKPATQMYATFSYMGDLRMWTDTLLEFKRQLLPAS